MKVATFRNIAHRLASTIGRRKGVKVVFAGHEAATDGQTILIPELPPGAWLSTVQAKVFMGYLDHEVGHVLLTNSPMYANEAKKRDSALFSYVLNVIEDVREELAYIKLYPGAKDDLDTLCQHLEGRVVEKVKDMPQSDMAKEMLALFYEECWIYRGRPRLMPWKLLDHKSGGKELTSILKEIPTLKDTTGTIRLASQVFHYLKKWDEQRPKQDGPQGMKVSIQMGVGSGQGGSGPKPSDGKEEAQGGKSSKSDAGSGQPSAGKGQQGELDKVAEALLKALDKQGLLKNLIEKAAEQTGQNAKSKKGHYKMEGTEVLPPLHPELDQIFVPTHKDRHTFAKVKTALQQEIATTRNALRVYLQSRNKRGWNRGLDDGELDDDQLWQTTIGQADRCYKDLRMSTTFNTALVLMIDMSSSMDADLVKKAAVLMMETGSFLPKVATMVAGFYAEHRSAGVYGDGGYRRFGRMNPMRIPLFKGFNEPYRDAKERIGSIRTTGYTPLGEAYAWALEALLAREEEKRVLWLVSDGEPYFRKGDMNHSDFILMEQTHTRCKKWRIETVGMELGTKPLKLSNYVDRSIKIPHENDLPTAVLSLARNLLGRTHS